MTNDVQRMGLTSTEAKLRQEQFGKNELAPQKKVRFFQKVLHTISEPMFLLLLLASTIYFLLGEFRDGAIMLAFVAGIIGIDAVQGWKTDRTLNALKDLSAPHVAVIRDGKEQIIASADLVPGDLMMIHEGIKLPADGPILKCADLCVDESSLTGESEGVWKVESDLTPHTGDGWRRDYCYAGTLAVQGTATVLVEQIGLSTEYGKIGQHISAAPEEPTPLQKQTGSLVRTCAAIAGALLLLVSGFTWFNLAHHALVERLVTSILAGVTLAMAMIPEEFPVILTVFLSMGAWRLAKKHSLVRRLPSVETLGQVSVLCVDKTGTITMNQMAVQEIWTNAGEEASLVEAMGLGCEIDAYDPMEKAMLDFCKAFGLPRDRLFRGKLVQEYAFTNELKMMGHVWRRDGETVIAAKGSPEQIFTICSLSSAQREEADRQIHAFAQRGLRVIAIAKATLEKGADIPASITDCKLHLLGLVGLADPPRAGVKEDIALCGRAGIRVVMITGDNGVTASAIAKQVGIPGSDRILTGDALSAMSDEELRRAVGAVSIFSRVAPQHKMRIVQAFKENGEIVAMMGDGVNDAPALKYADIGIAMGKRGSEVSREAADLILMDDNFTTIVETVKDGRRIYDNIRKAVGYVLTIHIPIALASLIAPLLGISPSDLLLLPLHVVLLELLIDPTCSIVLERQPAEADIMLQKPRNAKERLLTGKLLRKSLFQGLAIFAASFGAYLFTLSGNAANAVLARTMGLAVILFANLFLVQVNSSEYDPVFRSLRLLFKDRIIWAANLGTLALLGVALYTPLSALLKLAPLPAGQLLIALAIAAASVFWYELVKIGKRRARNKATVR